MFCDISVIHCLGRKKRFRVHNLAAGWVKIVSFLEGRNLPPPKKMPGINTGFYAVSLNQSKSTGLEFDEEVAA